MLRHKYSKKRLRNKYNRKKRTRKMRGGGGKSSKSSKFRKAKRKEGDKMNRDAINQSQKEDSLTPAEMRNLAQFKAMELEEKCESVNHVNDDGSIDCPKTRARARKKTQKFHPDRNPGCTTYANDMMTEYNKTCYGDDTNPDRKWDKNDKTWRNNAHTGFYTNTTSSGNSTSSGSGEKKDTGIPSSCRRPAKKMVCRYCQAKGVTDPKCKCCAGTDMAKAAIAKETKETKEEKTVLELEDTQPIKMEETNETKHKSWDASKTIGSCREMDLHPGTEYWINPADGSMSFEPIDGVEKQTVTEETDYFYNTEGKTTFDPSDGTCGNILTEKISETKIKKDDDFIELFFSTHFDKINEIDGNLSDKKQKVIPWLAKS